MRHNLGVQAEAAFIQRRPSMSDGEALKRAIRQRGYTVADFAKVAGVHPQTIRDWVSGRRATQLRVEWKVRWTLRQLPVMFGDIPGNDPFGDQAIPLPPVARAALGPGVLRPPTPDFGGSGHPSRFAPPTAALVVVGSEFEAFHIAMDSISELDAWLTWGYHLFSSTRFAATFRRAMEARRPWDAFATFAGDRQAWKISSAMTLKPWWP